MTGEGPTYCERQKERVKCGDCGKEMMAGLLEAHRMIQNGKAKADKWSWTETATGGGEPQTYHIEFPAKGGDKGMPSGGLPRKGQDMDGDEGAFLAPACPGHRDHLGGGKPPASKVLTMQHTGPMAVPQWATQEQRDVQEWGREEEMVTGADRDT